MPKREKTPPPPDDEPRYLTVVHPYPLNANLMLHADRRKLALWLACCTGKEVLLAMYHKPTVSGIPLGRASGIGIDGHGCPIWDYCPHESRRIADT
jgi:hypothetical protein